MIEKEEFSKAIIDRAKFGNHSAFSLLNNTSELFAAEILKHGLKSIYKNFYKVSKAFYGAYLIQKKQGIDNVALLFKHREFLTYAKFYEDEYDQICYEISEFFNYMFKFGNFINTLFGDDRPESEMYDHNKELYIHGDFYE